MRVKKIINTIKSVLGLFIPMPYPKEVQDGSFKFMGRWFYFTIRVGLIPLGWIIV